MLFGWIYTDWLQCANLLISTLLHKPIPSPVLLVHLRQMVLSAVG